MELETQIREDREHELLFNFRKMVKVKGDVRDIVIKRVDIEWRLIKYKE